MGTQAQLNTLVEVKPSGSQVVLVSLVILSGICLLTGFIFLWDNKSGSWIPLVLGIGILAISVIGWFRAQKDTDLEGSNSTTVSDRQGNQIITDTRALASPLIVQNLAILFSTLSHREPLPKPDGIVDKQGKPVPDSYDEAEQRVMQANLKAQEIASLAIREFGANINNEKSMQPLQNEPYSDAVIEMNKENIVGAI